MISPSSSTASSQPATSAKVVLGMSLEISFALDLANCMTPRPPPPCMEFISQRKSTTSRMIGRKLKMNELSRPGRETSTVDLLDLVVVGLALRGAGDLVLGAGEVLGGDLAAAVAVDAVVEGRLDDLVAVDEGDVLDLAALDVLVHLRRADLVTAAGADQELHGDEHADHRDDDPDQWTLEDALHGLLSATDMGEPTTVPNAATSSVSGDFGSGDPNRHRSLREDGSSGSLRPVLREVALGGFGSSGAGGCCDHHDVVDRTSGRLTEGALVGAQPADATCSLR